MESAGHAAVVETGEDGRAPLCVRCGYDLRGLPVDGACPECASPVAWSGDGLLLRFSGARLIRKLRIGAGLAAWAVGLEVASIVIVCLLVLTRRVHGWDAVAVVLLGLAAVALAAVVGATLRLIGWWLLTARDHRWAAQGRDLLSRRIIRWAMIVDLAVVAPGVVLTLCAGDGPQRIVGHLFLGLLWVHALAWVVQFFASMSYLRGLAERIPSTPVERGASTARWLVPVLGLGLGWIYGVGIVLAAAVYCRLLWRVRGELAAIR